MSVEDIFGHMLSRNPPDGLMVVNDPKTGFGTVKVPKGFGLLAGNEITFRHKMRWTMKLYQDNDVVLEDSYVKVSSRPWHSLEETELNFVGKAWIPGKEATERITLTRFNVREQWDVPFFNRVKLCLYGNGKLFESWDITGVQMKDVESDGGYGDDKSYYYTLDIEYPCKSVKYENSMTPWPEMQQKNQVTIE